MKNMFLAKCCIVISLCVVMNVVGMDNGALAINDAPLTQKDTEAVLCFYLSSKATRMITRAKAQILYPNLTFDSQQVRLIKVKIKSILNEDDRIVCWVPHEYILNDEVDFKFVYRENNIFPDNLTFDRSKKNCVRLLAASKINEEHAMELIRLQDLIKDKQSYIDAQNDDIARYINNERQFKQELQQQNEIYEKATALLEKETAQEKKIVELKKEIQRLQDAVQIKQQEYKTLLNQFNNEVGKAQRESRSLEDGINNGNDYWKKCLLATQAECKQAILWRNVFGGSLLACLAFIAYVLKTHHIFA